MSTTPTEVLVPRALRDYRCERTRMCCRAPFEAPVHAADEASLRVALAATDAGRALVADLDATLEPTSAPDTKRWAKPYGSCLHLVDATPGCRLHDACGAAALPTGCRNFPRTVQAVGDRWEVAFSLACPTAAKLVAASPEAFALVPLEAAQHPARPQSTRPADDRRAALSTRWLALLSGVRRDPEPLLMALGAMVEVPLAPPEIYELGEVAEALLGPSHEVAALTFSDQLFLMPERGRTYEAHRDPLLDELSGPWSVERALAATEAMPELLAAFAEHQLHALVVRPAPTDEALAREVRLIARRAAMVLRIVDALCDRVPYRSRTLFADAYAAVAAVDPDDGAEPYRGATLDPS